MLDLKKIKLPDTVEVDGNFFRIKTDFRDWLLFAELSQNEDSNLFDFDFIYCDNKPNNRALGYLALLDFYNPPRQLPRSTGESTGEKILDYNLDSELIYSAFLEVYNIDLLATENGKIKNFIHWHRFTALISGLHDTRLNEIMSYRSYTPDPKDTSEHAKQMKKLKTAWRLPQNLELSEATKEFNALFKK